MRGKKAKALRKMVGYIPGIHRPELARNMPRRSASFFSRLLGEMVPTSLPVTVVLPKEHPRRAYQFVKRRYGMLPLAQLLGKLRGGLEGAA